MPRAPITAPRAIQARRLVSIVHLLVEFLEEAADPSANA